MAQIPRRNVHVFSSSNGAEVAGEFGRSILLTFVTTIPWQAFSSTEALQSLTFIGWINEVCYIPVEWALYPSQFNNNRAVGGAALDSASGNELQPGRYVIRTPSPESAQIVVYLTTDVPRTRAYSVNYTYTPHETNFVTRVGARDSRCCITGDLVAGEDYTGFEAAHIFPLSETDIWNELNDKRFIEDDQIQPGMELNSIQQGFLCSSTEHRMFDDYSIGVNPDDNYRICDFVGRHPNRSPHWKIFYRNPNEQQHYLPSADLLRDHFRQCVLRHVKGAGESNEPHRRFDPDIDLQAGSFNLTAGSWWSGLEGKRQLEAELAGRLWGAVATQNQISEVEQLYQ
ncbi:hypothetical protein BDZ97DRAFT_2079926 [Flammula alnicola]|nr:hypothetical protein BDZ97DRAFT_2079926 [Flammula alnicola]